MRLDRIHIFYFLRSALKTLLGKSGKNLKTPAVLSILLKIELLQFFPEKSTMLAKGISRYP